MNQGQRFTVYVHGLRSRSTFTVYGSRFTVRLKPLTVHRKP